MSEEEQPKELTPPKIYQPEEVVQELLNLPSSTNREWVTHPTWTMNQVKALVDSRVQEVFFTEERDLLWVSERIADPDQANQPEYSTHSEERLETGRLASHIHPRKLPGYQNIQLQGYPTGAMTSWADIWNICYKPNPNARYVLFHVLGGIEYRIPQHDSLSPKELLTAFSAGKKIWCLPYGTKDEVQNMPRISNMTRREADRLASQFLDFANMRAKQDLWSNGSGMQRLINIINLKREE